jgi:DNA-binding response OmpR family regulator
MNPRILVVEDEEAILRTSGRASTARGSRRPLPRPWLPASETFERGRPTLVALDVMLPDGDWWDLTREIRQSDSDDDEGDEDVVAKREGA